MGRSSGARVAVVGAGLGGMAAAIRMAAAGREVHVFEKRQGPGGKASTQTLGNYRFDTGPSLLTMPDVFRDLFSAAGERMEDWMRPIRLPVICRYRYADGTVLDAYGDPAAFAREVASVTTDDESTVLRYLDYSRGIYERTIDLFLNRSLHEPQTYLDRHILSRLPALARIDALRSMHRANAAFFSDPRTVQLFDRYATYNGSHPYRVPATLNIIPWVEYGLGGYAVEGGIYQIPLAMERLAARLGVRFHYGQAVESIGHTNGIVDGVVVAGEQHSFRVVVSDADVWTTYGMLDAPDAPEARRYERLEPSSSGLVFYWGVRGEFPELLANNVFFSSDYEREFRQIFDDLVCPSDPTVYLNITCRFTSEDAPPGGENWFVLVNAPRSNGQDWHAEVIRTRAAVLGRLQTALGRDVESAIEEEGVLTPPMIEAETDSRYGSLYGISSNTRLAAFLRHRNRSTRFRGLYFCGGSAHPGGGMPMVLLSGKIVSELVERHEED